MAPEHIGIILEQYFSVIAIDRIFKLVRKKSLLFLSTAIDLLRY